MRAVAALLAILGMGCATPFGGRSWLRIQTPHLDLISSAGQARSVEIARGLEMFRATLGAVLPGANLEPRIPTLIYVFGDSQTFARFRTRADFAGFMIQRPHRNFLAVDAGRGEGALSTAYHEYVHFVLRNGGAVQYPAWYDEGFAEFLSTVEIEDEHVVIGGIPLERASWLLYGNPLGLRRVMLAGDVSQWPRRSLGRFYAQAWALTHFFYAAHHLGHPQRDAQLAIYLQLLNREIPPDEACERAFGASFEGIDQDFVRYVGKGEIPVFGLPRGRLSVPEVWSTRPLSRADAGYLLGDLALALGDDWLDEAEDWLRVAIATDPPSAAAHAALGQLLARADKPGADEHLARGLALAPEDAEVHRLYGEALLARALRSSESERAHELSEEARRHFRRSIELAPEQVAAYADIGRSHLVLPAQRGAQEGVEALRIAHQRLPADRSIGLWLAQLEIQVGSVDQARQLLAALPVRSHGDPAGAAEQDELKRARTAAGLGENSPSSLRHLESRLDVASPPPQARVTGLMPWIEVRGRAGLWESTLYDVVVALDESSSTLFPTGSDLDGDGRVGKAWSQRFSWSISDYSTDPEDAVVRAELEAARALIRQLDPRTVRVAVVNFAGRARILAPLGPPKAALDAIDTYEVHVDPTGTSLALALAASLQAFVDGRDLESRRQRVILLLSDGQPTVPTVYDGKRAALELADQLGDFGIPVHAFALGEEALEDPEFYRELAERSQGRFIPVERPAEVVAEVSRVRFTGLEEVSIVNLTSNVEARAVRVFPDGTFDGYAALVAGENQLEVTAHLEGAPALRERRTIFFAPPESPGPGDEQAARELRAELERRAIEIELLGEMRRRRSAAQERELEVEPEADRTGP